MKSKWSTGVTVKQFSVLQRIVALAGDRSIKPELKKLCVPHHVMFYHVY